MNSFRTIAGEVEIRAALPADAAALSALISELGFPAAADVVLERLERLQMANERILVACIDRSVVAVASLHITPVLHRPAPVGRITALVVRESDRRRGIGRILVAAAERELRNAGCGIIELTSHQKLTEAHAFYRRLGYEMSSYRFFKPL